MGSFTCAKDCPGRSATCHGTCEKYLREVEANTTERTARRKASRSRADIESYKARLKLTPGGRNGKGRGAR